VGATGFVATLWGRDGGPGERFRVTVYYREACHRCTHLSRLGRSDGEQDALGSARLRGGSDVRGVPALRQMTRFAYNLHRVAAGVFLLLLILLALTSTWSSVSSANVRRAW
jgi:hypothetical protein